MQYAHVHILYTVYAQNCLMMLSEVAAIHLVIVAGSSVDPPMNPPTFGCFADPLPYVQIHDYLPCQIFAPRVPWQFLRFEMIWEHPWVKGEAAVFKFIYQSGTVPSKR